MNTTRPDVDDSRNMDMEETLFMLNFAMRTLATDQDREELLENMLETLCDFARTTRATILTRDPLTGKLCVDCARVDGEIVHPQICITYNEHFKEMMRLKQPQYLPMDPAHDYPMPLIECPEAERTCYCLPLVGAGNKVVGLAVAEHIQGKELDQCSCLQCRVLATFMAISLENNRLFKLAIEDELTGLSLRRYFEIRLREEMARVERQGEDLSLVYLDIDDFKSVNDTHGHDVGDQVLRQLAAILKVAARRGVDVVCRYGGEEFVVLLPCTSMENAMVVAERMRSFCEDHKFTAPTLDAPLRVTISLGLAHVDGREKISPQEFVRRADQMLYTSKQTGKNRTTAWGPETATS